MDNKLFILRGVSGSGKSTLARSMCSQTPNLLHFEADMYVTDKDGNYNWRPETVKDSHSWCFNEVERTLRCGMSCIVSNTFSRKWEFQKYIDLCNELGIEYEIIICKGEYKNCHNVPDEIVQKMKERFEY